MLLIIIELAIDGRCLREHELSVSSGRIVDSPSSYKLLANAIMYSREEANEDALLSLGLHTHVAYHRSEVLVQKSLVLSREYGS